MFLAEKVVACIKELCITYLEEASMSGEWFFSLIIHGIHVLK